MNEIFAMFPQITGVKRGDNIATKTKCLAGDKFVVYLGNVPEWLEALSDAELQTPNNTFEHPATMDRSEILAHITEFVDSQEDHTDPLSEDPSGTDQEWRPLRDEESKSQITKNKSGKARKSTWTSSKRTARGDDEEQDESFSDDSEEAL